MLLNLLKIFFIKIYTKKTIYAEKDNPYLCIDHAVIPIQKCHRWIHAKEGNWNLWTDCPLSKFILRIWCQRTHKIHTRKNGLFVRIKDVHILCGCTDNKWNLSLFRQLGLLANSLQIRHKQNQQGMVIFVGKSVEKQLKDETHFRCRLG